MLLFKKKKKKKNKQIKLTHTSNISFGHRVSSNLVIPTVQGWVHYLTHEVIQYGDTEGIKHFFYDSRAWLSIRVGFWH